MCGVIWDPRNKRYIVREVRVCSVWGNMGPEKQEIYSEKGEDLQCEG